MQIIPLKKSSGGFKASGGVSFIFFARCDKSGLWKQIVAIKLEIN